MSDLKSSANVRFYTCSLPDAESVMPPCDRPLYAWAESLPVGQRPAYLEAEMQRIRNAADQTRFQQWRQCEASRFAPPPVPASGVRVAVRGHLDKTRGATSEGNQKKGKTRLAVHFAPDSSATPDASHASNPSNSHPMDNAQTPPPAGCPALPFHLLHEVDRMGINHYPHNTRIAFLDSNEAQYYNGIGPWEGGKVFMAWTPRDAVRHPLNVSFRFSMRVESAKIFDHWAVFRIIANADVPQTLLDRLEPYSPAAVEFKTSVAFDWRQPEGQRGHGWRVVHEYTHLDSNRSWMSERFDEFPSGWIELPMGGYGAQHTLGDNVPEAPARELFMPDGHWRHRVCVMEFIRPATKVEVVYQNETMTEGISAIGGTVSTPYVPGVTPGEASVSESATIHTVGITKASFRLIDVQPVPGIGVLITLTVMNELHFPACIVTPFISGLRHFDTHFYVDHHCTLAWAILVRNLPAHSESAPVSVLVPLHIEHAGDWVLRDLHWRGSGFPAFPAPSGQYPDGIYGFGSASAIPELSDWPPPAYPSCSNPNQLAFLLAGIRIDGERIWNTSWDGEADLERPVVTIPARLAPGAPLPTVYHPRFNAPSSADQSPFLCFYAWTAEANVGNDTWQPRSGQDAVGLDLAQALARYGRTLTLAISAGRPFWSDYSQRWLTAFATWPGDTADTLELYLIDTVVRPRFKPEAGWRNFQYTSLKKPYLVTGTTWTYESSAFTDDPSRLHVAPLVKETTATDTVDVAIVGIW